jgi:pyrimidine operon attenuation protein/uracil phosphoribosyltransferase
MSTKILEAYKTRIEFLFVDIRVVLVDVVLYKGRSINSALTALQSFGRPRHVELLILIDRRFSRHLPIQPDYRGRQVDAINEEQVKVHWKENNQEDTIYLLQETEQ